MGCRRPGSCAWTMRGSTARASFRAICKPRVRKDRRRSETWAQWKQFEERIVFNVLFACKSETSRIHVFCFACQVRVVKFIRLLSPSRPPPPPLPPPLPKSPRTLPSLNRELAITMVCRALPDLNCELPIAVNPPVVECQAECPKERQVCQNARRRRHARKNADRMPKYMSERI